MFLRRRPFALHILAALAALFSASSAYADEPAKPFGERGSIAFDDIFRLGIGRSGVVRSIIPTHLRGEVPSYGGVIGYSNGDGKDSQFDRMWFNPSFDVFVTGGLSIGANVAVMHENITHRLGFGVGDDDGFIFVRRTKAFTVMPRVGYAIPISPSFALWPRLAIGYIGGYVDKVSHDGSGNREVLSKCMAVVDVGLVARVHRNIYLRAAPELSIGIETPESRCSLPARSTQLTVDFGGTVGIGLLFGS